MADSEDSRERRRAKARARYQANLEKVRTYAREWARAYRAANSEKYLAYERLWRETNREEYRARRRAFRAANADRERATAAKGHAKWLAANPEKAKWIYGFHSQKCAAKQRRIPFLLTFEEWQAIWIDSGKWEQRGKKSNQYCMARHGDTGPYAIGNVRICTVRENHAEQKNNRGEWVVHV